MSLTSWFLVNNKGTRHRLPREMIFVGREDCELMLQSRSVDKQHAVINHEATSDEHLVKDLGSLNGTFVNNIRIPEQTYITLKPEDKLRFGYDTNIFTLVRGEMKVPEEVLKHEKFSSQLHILQRHVEEGFQLNSSDLMTNVNTEVQQTTLDALKSEEKTAADLCTLPRGTPLYGQPSWWGDEVDPRIKINQDNKDSKLHDSSASGCSKDGKEAHGQITALKEESMNSVSRETSYFEIPIKGLQDWSDDVPAGNQQCPHVAGTGHASFTIEFDDSSPGKVTIKDHVTKFSDHRPKPKKYLPSEDKEADGLHSEMMAAESKVAVWLAHNNAPRLLKEAAEEDAKSVKSDVPVYLKRLQGSRHDDGTQSDYENNVTHLNQRKILLDHTRQRNLDRKKLEHRVQTVNRQQEISTQTAFLIEIFDDIHPRKKRSHSFSLNASAARLEAPYPILQSQLEKVKTASVDDKGFSSCLHSGSSSHRVIHSTQHAKLLLKQKSEEPCTSLLFTQNVLLRSSGSLGRRPINKGITSKDVELHSLDKCHMFSHLEENSKSKEENEAPNGKDTDSSSGKKHWMSQWASLASTHAIHDQDIIKTESNVPTCVENDECTSASGQAVISTPSITSVSGQTDQKLRNLPKQPKDEIKSLDPANNLSYRTEIGEKQDTELQEKESPTHVNKKDKLCFSDGLATERTGGRLVRGSMEKAEILKERSQSSFDATRKNTLVSASSNHTVYKTQLEQTKKQLTGAKIISKPSMVHPNKWDLSTNNVCSLQKYADVHEKHEKYVVLKNNIVESNHNVRSHENDKKEPAKPLVRQGSFTIDKPSTNVPIELIPHINKQSVLPPPIPLTSVNNMREKSDSVGKDSSMDTTLVLKDTEAVMALLEAKLRDENKTDEDPKTSGYPEENSISPESDVDTASTISFVASESDKKYTKKKSFSNVQKEKSSSKESSNLSANITREKTEIKHKTNIREVGTRNYIRKMIRSNARHRQPSLDLTDDDQTSSLPCSAVSDILCFDQETGAGNLIVKVQSASADNKLLSSKCPAGNKSMTLPRPRPTRTSLLRRSRLGDASDTEVLDNDRASVASEVSTTSSTSKQPTGKKPISRIDFLAQPRRATLGSISARSDSEATMSRSSGSSRAPQYTVRRGLKSAPTADCKSLPRARANSISRLPDAQSKTVALTHSSPTANTRWRRIPPEYASTSEEEFGSNCNSAKASRIRASPSIKIQRSQVTGSCPVITPSGTLNVSAFKYKAKEQEDYIRDWTAHREEIARISQDLALIAQEINDVAGEIDSVTSSGTAPSTTVSTAATTPGSAIDTREELVDRVFDESLNFRKIPPSNSYGSESKFRSSESRTKDSPETHVLTRRKTWSRDEIMGDSLLLSSVFQFSRKIRQTIDKTATKIRILFKDREHNCDEIEKKLRSESEIPILKASCTEIVSIFQELKQIEKQLQVINVIIDPDGTLDALNIMGFANSTLTAQPKYKQKVSMQIASSSVPTRTECRTSRLGGGESDPDFTMRFNRVNPDGKEDPTLHE